MNYPLTGSPIPIIALVVVYVYYVIKWGPQWMEKRPAYDLQGYIKIYNLIQIGMNLFIGVYVSVINLGKMTKKMSLNRFSDTAMRGKMKCHGKLLNVSRWYGKIEKSRRKKRKNTSSIFIEYRKNRTVLEYRFQSISIVIGRRKIEKSIEMEKNEIITAYKYSREHVVDVVSSA